MVVHNSSKYCSYEKAKKFAHTLNFKRKEDWIEYVKTNKLPKDIPKSVYYVYHTLGTWISWSDFLGYDPLQKELVSLFTLEDFRKFMKLHDISTRDEWNYFCKHNSKKIPKGFPTAISGYCVRRNIWKGWSYIFNKRDVRKIYKTYKEHQELAEKHNLTSTIQWESHWKKHELPEGYTIGIERYFKNKKEWKRAADFFRKRSNVITKSYDEHKKLAKKINAKTIQQWDAHWKKHELPDGYGIALIQYFQKTKEWDAEDFFDKKMKSYEELKKFLKPFKLKSEREYFEFKENNPQFNIPSSPHKYYKSRNSWISYPDLLNTKNQGPNRNFYEFLEAKKHYSLYGKQIGLDKSNSPKKLWDSDSKENLDDRLPKDPTHHYSIKKVKERLRGIKKVNELLPGVDYYYDFYDTFGIEDPDWSTNKIIELLKSWLEDDYLINADPIVINTLYENRKLGKINGKFSRVLKLVPENSQKREFNDFLKKCVETKGECINESAVFENPLSLESLENPEGEEIVKENEIVEINENHTYSKTTSSEILDQPESENLDKLFERAQKSYELINDVKFNPKTKRNTLADKEVVEFYLRHFINKLWSQVFSNKDKIKEIKKSKKSIGTFANEIKTTFLKEYDEATSLKTPDDYQFYPPTLMQQHFATKVLEKKYYANFSGTGAGKTISALLAGRLLNSKMTLIICPNSVVEQWRDVIKAIFSSYEIHTKNNAFSAIYDKNKFQYLIINYDKFNQTWSKNNILELSKQKINYVILDEIHYSKTSEVEHQSTRRQRLDELLSLIRERNPEAKTVGLTATPVVNNLIEGRSILELLSGQDWTDDVKILRTRSNAMKLHEKFAVMSIRQEPEYELPIINEDIVVAKIPKDIRLSNISHDRLLIEQYCTMARIPEIINRINGKTIIYTEFVGGAIPNHPTILQMLEEAVKDAGFRCEKHTGENHFGKDRFIENKNIQVLIASQPLGTGVDGLQDVCKNIIFNNLPWTHAQYAQVIGRLIRKGQKFKVTVNHILAKVDYQDQISPYDIDRLNTIKDKKTILDCAVSGIIPNKDRARKNTIIKSLREWIKRLEKGRRLDILRPYRIYDLTPEEIKSRKREFGDFETINKMMIKSRSETTFDKIKKNPKLWYAYHTGLNEAKKKWDYDPNEIWIEYISKLKKFKKIADFGCGEAVIGREFGPKRVQSFDLHSIDDELVTTCNIKKTPLKNSSVDIAIYNLSLTATDWKDFIIECKRVLNDGGLLFIADTVNHLNGYLKELPDVLEELDFKIFTNRPQGQFVIIQAIKM